MPIMEKDKAAKTEDRSDLELVCRCRCENNRRNSMQVAYEGDTGVKKDHRAFHPQQDVFRDQLCPPNKQYDLIDATKKIDLVNPQCLNESKILGDILNHHPLRFSLVASDLVHWIYIKQFWHTLKLDDSKDKLKFFLYTKEFKFLVDDFRRVFQLPQATDNNNDAFVDAPTFSDMLPFFRNELGFSLPMRLPTHFVTKGLPQP
ncbi:hypothetical protein Tco_0178104 [Tanacetum coccineum]